MFNVDLGATPLKLFESAKFSGYIFVSIWLRKAFSQLYRNVRTVLIIISKCKNTSDIWKLNVIQTYFDKSQTKKHIMGENISRTLRQKMWCWHCGKKYHNYSTFWKNWACGFGPIYSKMWNNFDTFSAMSVQHFLCNVGCYFFIMWFINTTGNEHPWLGYQRFWL